MYKLKYFVFIFSLIHCMNICASELSDEALNTEIKRLNAIREKRQKAQEQFTLLAHAYSIFFFSFISNMYHHANLIKKKQKKDLETHPVYWAHKAYGKSSQSADYRKHCITDHFDILPSKKQNLLLLKMLGKQIEHDHDTKRLFEKGWYQNNIHEFMSGEVVLVPTQSQNAKSLLQLSVVTGKVNASKNPDGTLYILESMCENATDDNSRPFQYFVHAAHILKHQNALLFLDDTLKDKMHNAMS
jgi:hypothetical protein